MVTGKSPASEAVYLRNVPDGSAHVNHTRKNLGEEVTQLVRGSLGTGFWVPDFDTRVHFTLPRCSIDLQLRLPFKAKLVR